MKNHVLAAFVTLALAAGCGSTPDGDSPLAQARADYSAAQANPQVTSLAPSELRQASDSLDKANAAATKREDRAIVDHLAYVTRQHVAIAQETARQKAAEQAVASSGAERDRVRLDARTREADAAQRSAEYSRRQSEASQRSAEAARLESESAQRNAEAARRQTEASRLSAEEAQRQAAAERLAAADAQSTAQAAQRQAEAQRQAAADAQASAQVSRQQSADAMASAQASRQQSADAESRARQLEAQLRELEAKKTDRGMVVTLGDVLFDTNQAQLKAGGVRNVQRLADFFKQYPQRNVMIEGFTDSTGTMNRNQELSNERAHSVRTALLDMGMGSERITTRGYGESYPAASNDTAAGRQLNRRVEIVVSDDTGKIAPR
jgi:outer membrane protein OmpA-like peptidoglycan-associated protein